MIPDQDQAACPSCGARATVRSLAELVAANGPGVSPAMRAWAEGPSPSAPLSDWSGQSSALGESGGGADLGDSAFGFAMAAGAYVLHRTVGRRMKRYVRDHLAEVEGNLQAATASSSRYTSATRTCACAPTTRCSSWRAAGGSCRWPACPLAGLPIWMPP